MKKEKPGKKEEGKTYTVTEVGTILESLRTNIKTIAEGHEGLDKRLENVEIEVHGNSRRLEMVELKVGVTNDKARRLEDAVSKLSKDLGGMREELNSTRKELKGEIQSVREELKAEIARVDQKLEAKIDEFGNRLIAVETRR